MTGYPADLLDPDLDLEADLGVDTVKQAEVFAAVRTQWNLERDDTLQLREFPTLNHVAGWVRDQARRPTGCRRAAPAAAAAPAPPRPPAAPDRRRPHPRRRHRIVAEMTGYPADLLDPDLDLEADLGVDTVKQAEVFAAVRTQWNLERDDTLQLREFPTLNHVAGWVRDQARRPPTRRSRRRPRPPGRTDAAAAAAPHTVLGDLDAVDALPRRVPVPVAAPGRRPVPAHRGLARRSPRRRDARRGWRR